MKKPASKVAEPAQIQPKSQFLFHKNLLPRDFSLMTLLLKDEKYSILVEFFFPWDCSYPIRTFKCIKKPSGFVLATVWILEVAMALFLCV